MTAASVNTHTGQKQIHGPMKWNREPRYCLTITTLVWFLTKIPEIYIEKRLSWKKNGHGNDHQYIGK